MKIALAGLALSLFAATATAPGIAHAYDPCQRAHEDRIPKRDAMRRYIANQCPANARHVPADCNHPQRGWQLLEELSLATQRVMRECNG